MSIKNLEKISHVKMGDPLTEREGLAESMFSLGSAVLFQYLYWILATFF